MKLFIFPIWNQLFTLIFCIRSFYVIYPLFWFSLFSLISLPAGELDQKLHDAYQAYQLALLEENLAQQEKHFNIALTLYHEVEEQLSPDRSLARISHKISSQERRDEPNSFTIAREHYPTAIGSQEGKTDHSDARVCEKCGLGPLFYNIGNIYFYLSQYPLAITYYYRAAQTMPNDPLLVQNLNKALEKIHEGQVYTPPSITYVEILEILGSLVGLAFLLFSLWIWMKNKFIFFTGIGVGIVGFVFLCIAIFWKISAPIDAIVISPTLLHKGASEEFPIISENPLFPGTKVHVLDVVHQGKWLKISHQGEIGYLSYETIRVI